MINLIYGGKGSGKTTALVTLANTNVSNAKGFHIYIDKNNARMHDLDRAVKLVDASEYAIETAAEFLAFVRGMVAVNYDIEKIYIDNLNRILKSELADMANVFDGLNAISSATGVDFVVTALGEKTDLPEFLQKYL